jgi:hypothetical protein
MPDLAFPGAPVSTLPQSQINIQYNDSDVSGIIQPNKVRLVYHDRISYQSDNLEFVIADPDGIFRNQWSFKTGGTSPTDLVGRNCEVLVEFNPPYCLISTTVTVPLPLFGPSEAT